jgi:hypothetical protein
MQKTILPAGLLFLAACGDDRPPAPTAEQSDQLNQAEELLNQQAANEKGPEDRAPGPSQ